MGKVLYIKANARPESISRTYRIANHFVETYKKNHPDDEIITLDLYREEIRFLTNNDLEDLKNLTEEESRHHPVWKYAWQFAEASKYIIAEPLWNLSVPAILKAYLDYVTVAGITFEYTVNGPVGLCQGRKAINITSRGGAYLEGHGAAFEMGDRYLRTLFAFLGIRDFITIATEELDVIGTDVENLVVKAIAEAEEKAKTF